MGFTARACHEFVLLHPPTSTHLTIPSFRYLSYCEEVVSYQQNLKAARKSTKLHVFDHGVFALSVDTEATKNTAAARKHVKKVLLSLFPEGVLSSDSLTDKLREGRNLLKSNAVNATAPPSVSQAKGPLYSACESVASVVAMGE